MTKIYKRRLKAIFLSVMVVALGTACAGGQVVDQSAVDRGSELYAANCQSCHGEAATGEQAIPNAPPHGPQGHTWHHPDGQLTAIILGQFDYPGRAMPSFEGQLSEKQVADILAFLKTNWTKDQLDAQAEASRNWERLQEPNK